MDRGKMGVKVRVGLDVVWYGMVGSSWDEK